MAQSFSLRSAGPLAATDPRRRRVLITGAAGNIGSYLAEHSTGRYDLRLMVRGDEDDAGAIARFGEVVTARLDDLERLKEVCRGVDTVVHLAADPDPGATWDSLLPNNVVGTYNTMVAAKSAGVRRLIYASSIHAVSGYPADVQVKTTDPVNPGDLYGVTKCFGEALGRYMAEQEGLSVIALRIGAFQPAEKVREPAGISMLDAWVSRRDLVQLIHRCIDAGDGLRWAVFNAISDNRFKRLDLSDARELVGYAPQDDLTEENPRLAKLDLDDIVPAHSRADGEKPSGIRNEL